MNSAINKTLATIHKTISKEGITMSNYSNNQQKQSVPFQDVENELFTVKSEPPKFNLGNGIAILKSLTAIQKELIDAGGISKSRSTDTNKPKTTNNGYNNTPKKSAFDYNYRGIDDIYNAISPMLANNNVLCIPNVEDTNVSKFLNKYGDLVFKTTLVVRYTLISSEDGSSIETTFVGEANDSGDKSASKALSMAQKYMFIQTFAIPTEESQRTEQQHQANQQQGDNNGYYQLNSDGFFNNQASNQNIPYSDRPASLEFKNKVDEIMRPYNQRLNEVAKENKLDLQTITHGQLDKLKKDFLQHFSQKQH